MGVQVSYGYSILTALANVASLLLRFLLSRGVTATDLFLNVAVTLLIPFSLQLARPVQQHPSHQSSIRHARAVASTMTLYNLPVHLAHDLYSLASQLQGTQLILVDLHEAVASLDVLWEHRRR